jgi:hypothetical protein
MHLEYSDVYVNDSVARETEGRWGVRADGIPKYLKRSISSRCISGVSTGRTRLPTFHECHDLLTQVSLRVFEIIRRPCRGRPVTIHEAVTVVRREIKPTRNPRASGNPRKRHGEINNRRNATCRHVSAWLYGGLYRMSRIRRLLRSGASGLTVRD